MMSKSFFYFVGLLCGCLILQSCEKETEVIPPASVEHVVFVYAVNNSSLAYDFIDDRNEMETALKSVTDNQRLLLYCIDNDRSAPTAGCPVLLEAVRDGEEIVWRELNRYDRNVPSTDAGRIADVIQDALGVYPEARYDLFFWGHGTAWFPSGRSKKTPDAEAGSYPELHGYGGEYSDTGKTLWTDVDRLAEAVPDGRFDTIWFDCCYMSNIETIYEFQGKCDTFVGYATEVWQYGLPYDLVFPYLMKDAPDIAGAAKRFFDYYNDNGEPVTVAVTDMAGLERLADASKEILHSGDKRPATGELVRYSRSMQYAFYDFGEYIRLTARRNIPSVTSPGYDEAVEKSAAMIAEFNEAMAETVIYHAASATDFNRRPWDTAAISGISTHWLDPTKSPDPFYTTLRWYRRVCL